MVRRGGYWRGGGGRRWGWPHYYNRFYYPIYNYSYPYDLYGLDRTVVVEKPVKETTVIQQHTPPWIWAVIGGAFIFFVALVAIIASTKSSK